MSSLSREIEAQRELDRVEANLQEYLSKTGTNLDELKQYYSLVS